MVRRYHLSIKLNTILTPINKINIVLVTLEVNKDMEPEFVNKSSIQNNIS